MKKKTLTMLIALVLVLACAVGGTLAWLTANTGTVTNTFTVGNINLDLYEHDANDEVTREGVTYDVVPGTSYDKDPTVVVKENSEICWLFVKVNEDGNAGILQYVIDSTWKAVPDHAGYYYIEKAEVGEYNVLKDKKITISGDLTKEVIDSNDFEAPTLSFTAAAVQDENVDDVDSAWAKLSKEFTGETSAE